MDINVKKASCHGGVSPHPLKHCTNELTTPPVLILYQSLVSGVWPSQWNEVGAEKISPHLPPLGDQLDVREDHWIKDDEFPG